MGGQTLETLYVYASWKKIKCVCLQSTETAFTQHKHDKYSLLVNKRSKASQYRDFQKVRKTLSIPQQINDTQDCNKTSILVQKNGVNQDMHFIVKMALQYLRNLQSSHCILREPLQEIQLKARLVFQVISYYNQLTKLNIR